jgi:hypothetical protein
LDKNHSVIKANRPIVKGRAFFIAKSEAASSRSFQRRDAAATLRVSIQKSEKWMGTWEQM